MACAALWLPLTACGQGGTEPGMDERTASPVATPEPVMVPEQAHRWQRTQARYARQEIGPDAPVALLGAQVHAESHWQPEARSPVGAEGLAQFMPGTAEHVAELGAGEGQPTSPRWSLRAQAVYTGWLLERLAARSPNPVDDVALWAFALSAYNGGLGWLDEERATSKDPARWYTTTRQEQARSDAAWQENREYVDKIYRKEPSYRDQGWPGPTVKGYIRAEKVEVNEP